MCLRMCTKMATRTHFQSPCNGWNWWATFSVSARELEVLHACTCIHMGIHILYNAQIFPPQTQLLPVVYFYFTTISTDYSVYLLLPSAPALCKQQSNGVLLYPEHITHMICWAMEKDVWGPADFMDHPEGSQHPWLESGHPCPKTTEILQVVISTVASSLNTAELWQITSPTKLWNAPSDHRESWLWCTRTFLTQKPPLWVDRTGKQVAFWTNLDMFWIALFPSNQMMYRKLWPTLLHSDLLKFSGYLKCNFFLLLSWAEVIRTV